MSAVQGLSASTGFSALASTQATYKSKRSGRANNEAQFQATFEKDLTQAGLKADVTPDALLKSIQSAVKTAISDSSNNGKDLLEVIQTAVQKTLKDNGVDTEKLASLLQSQAATQSSSSGEPTSKGRPNGSHSGGPPPGGPPPGGPPPGGGPGRPHGHHGGSSSVGGSSDNDDDSTSSTSSTSSSTSSTDSNSTITSKYKSRFEQIVADLIKSLPSGSALDLTA